MHVDFRRCYERLPAPRLLFIILLFILLLFFALHSVFPCGDRNHATFLHYHLSFNRVSSIFIIPIPGPGGGAPYTHCLYEGSADRPPTWRCFWPET